MRSSCARTRAAREWANPGSRAGDMGAAVVAALALVSTLGCSDTQRPHVSFRIEPSTLGAMHGGRVSVLLRAEVPKSWHLYSSAQIRGGPDALTVVVLRDDVFVVDGLVAGPPATRSLDSTLGIATESYTGPVEFAVPIRVVPSVRPGRYLLRIAVHSQACTLQLCLPPRDDTLAAVIAIRP